MKCQNCRKNEANFKYTQIINGQKKELILCEECSKKLGVYDMDFNMSINIPDFFQNFLDDYEEDFVPMLSRPKQLKCKSCNMLYEEFAKGGKFGCADCYNSFSEKIKPILKRVQGSSKYIGRKIKERGNVSIEHTNEETTKKETEKEKLEEKLKLAIKEERYEDAARIRDEIKKGN